MDEQSAIARLRETLKPGDTVHTVLRHVSRSGMSRAIDAYKLADGDRIWLSPAVAGAGVGRWSDRYEAVNMAGAGMDMGFALVYSLSRRVFPEYDCTSAERYPEGDRSGGCPSNEHVNPGPNRDRYGPGVRHTDGYALHHRWL